MDDDSARGVESLTSKAVPTAKSADPEVLLRVCLDILLMQSEVVSAFRLLLMATPRSVVHDAIKSICDEIETRTNSVIDALGERDKNG